MFYIFESSKTLVFVLGVHGSTRPNPWTTVRGLNRLVARVFNDRCAKLTDEE